MDFIKNLTNKQALVAWFIISNGALFLIFTKIDIAEDGVFKELTTGLLCAILLNIVTLLFEIGFLFQEKLRDMLTIEKNISQLVDIINREQKLKQEINELITIYSKIHDAGDGVLIKTPNFVKEVFKNESTYLLAELNSRLSRIKIGELPFSNAHCLQATMACMQGTKRKIFAISFPDINFWKDDGQSYLDSNRETIQSKKVNIIRFFIIRGVENEREVLTNLGKKAKFIEILKSQVALNAEQGVKGKITVYVTDDRLHNYRQIRDNMTILPDISTYDDAVVSEWITRQEDDKIDESRLSFSQASIDLAKDIENYLLKNARAKAFEITKPEMVDSAVEGLIQLLKDKNKMS